MFVLLLAGLDTLEGPGHQLRSAYLRYLISGVLAMGHPEAERGVRSDPRREVTGRSLIVALRGRETLVAIRPPQCFLFSQRHPEAN